MEKIQVFIESFIDVEFHCNYAKYDIGVSDEQYADIKEAAYSYYDAIVPNPFGRKPIGKIIGDSIWEARYARTQKEFRTRTLFQIRHYQKPQIGEALQRVMNGDDLFGCILSYEQDTGKPLFIAAEFFCSRNSRRSEDSL